jgi:hypothetical protein
MRMRAACLSVGVLASWAAADTVTLVADADATIYSDEAGLLANGAGIGVFTGNNSVENTRRALMHFDLTQLPPGATVTGASLVLHLSSSMSGAQPVALHRALTAWSEGPSEPEGTGGRGAEPEEGDATWLHTRFDTEFWGAAGGDFAAQASATTVVVDDVVDYTWSGAALTADVQGWAADPASNFGWFVTGVETGFQTSKRFASRESAPESFRPRLVLTYTVDPGPCYANCDASTLAPVLNVLDFNCFLNRFSAGAAYANCDASTLAPVLNVLDFNCFLNRFSQGCP